MMRFHNKDILALWLVWVCILFSFQAWAAARALPLPPDEARVWTAAYTSTDALPASRSAMDPALHQQAAWDSVYYLSIARHGYEGDPAISSVTAGDRQISLSYAFPPFYPFLIRLASLATAAAGMQGESAYKIAGVLISINGALAGCLALAGLAEHTSDDKTRAVFMLLVFPSAFFLAQIYSEGLFIGLSFGALWAFKVRRWWLGGVLAAGAALTRIVGVALVIPLALEALPALRKHAWRETALIMAAAAMPVIAFGFLQVSTWGKFSEAVQGTFYNRGLFNLARVRTDWGEALNAILHGPVASSAYHLMEMGLTVMAFASSLHWLKRDAKLACYSLAVLTLALLSGDLQGMYRYALAAPAVFLTLGEWSKNTLFERAWLMVSLPLMGFNAWLFAVNFWAG